MRLDLGLHKRGWSDVDEFPDNSNPYRWCYGGGKGGGGSAPAPPPPPTDQTINQSGLPEYVEPFFTRLLQRTEAESNAPYQPYGDPRLTQFGADTSAGFQGIRDVSQAGRPDLFQTAQTALGQSAGYTPQAFTDSGVAQAYMDPFIGNVLDVQKQRANERFEEQRLGREAAAVQAGAYGGSGRHVQEAIAQREINRQLNEIEAQGLSDAYRTGAGIFGRDQAARLQAESQRVGAAGQLGTQALAEDQLALERARAQAGVGGALEEKEQAALDIAYSDFINQRDFPRQQLNFMSGILHGVPIAAQQETTTFQAPPSGLSQLLGTGLAGVGLARQLGVVS